MKLADILLPRRMVCFLCGMPTHGDALCRDCQAELDTTRLHETARPDVFMEATCSAWYHEGAARKLVHRLKYDAVADAAEVLAVGMAEAARANAYPMDAVVTSVPMPEKRQRARGIDHGRTLAEAVAAALSLRYEPLMTRTGKAHTQRGLSRAQRLRNLTNAFAAAPLDGMKVMLIDAVLTTGATSHACARTLKEAGASGVWVLTATKARRDKDTHWLRRWLRRKGWIR